MLLIIITSQITIVAWTVWFNTNRVDLYGGLVTGANSATIHTVSLETNPDAAFDKK